MIFCPALMNFNSPNKSYLFYNIWKDFLMIHLDVMLVAR